MLARNEKKTENRHLRYFGNLKIKNFPGAAPPGPPLNHKERKVNNSARPPGTQPRPRGYKCVPQKKSSAAPGAAISLFKKGKPPRRTRPTIAILAIAAAKRARRAPNHVHCRFYKRAAFRTFSILKKTTNYLSSNATSASRMTLFSPPSPLLLCSSTVASSNHLSRCCDDLIDLKTKQKMV